MAIAEGSLLGPYRIVRKVGEGGMGTVYEALHETIERRVAIKVLHAEFAREPDIASRFVNEARAVNRVNHPGVVSVFDFSHPANGQPYIVMEFLEGERMSERMERCGGLLPMREAVRLGEQLASALAAAHEKGIIHRDLKPDNVMLVRSQDAAQGERAKLLDFGLAKLIDRPGTKSGVIMGTPQYMSPEQCRDAKLVSDRSDVYSLGVLLFECLAGRLPLLAESAGELIAMHLHTPPPPLIQVAPDVPARLASFVDRMLSKDSLARPSAPQVAEELEAIWGDLSATRAASLPIRPGGSVRIAVAGTVSADEFEPTLAAGGSDANRGGSANTTWRPFSQAKWGIALVCAIAAAIGIAATQRAERKPAIPTAPRTPVPSSAGTAVPDASPRPPDMSAALPSSLSPPAPAAPDLGVSVQAAAAEDAPKKTPRKGVRKRKSRSEDSGIPNQMEYEK